jgi:hypothetical protein
MLTEDRADPRSRVKTRNRDLTPTFARITSSDLLDCQPTPMVQALEIRCNRAKSR